MNDLSSSQEINENRNIPVGWLIILKEKQLIDITCDVFTCDQQSIQSYLYEPGLTKKENAKQFNFIDMVFIEGDANLRPWSPQARAFLLLIKMCIKSNKIMWASSFAMQAVVYLLATNIEKSVNIINGLNGGNIKTLKNSFLNVEEMKNNDLFLDNITGDLFKYEMQVKAWRPFANVGMHCRKQAQENPNPGKIIMKPEVKRPNSKHDSLQQLYVGQNTEQIVYLKKIFINHYCLEGVQHEFLSPSKNSWDLNLINFPNPQLTFKVLADSKFTSEIIELNENIMATQFNISKKYPETAQILINFIKHHMYRVQKGVEQIPIENASYKLLDGSIGGDQAANLLDDSQIIPQPNKNCFQQNNIQYDNPHEKYLKSSQYKLLKEYQSKASLSSKSGFQQDKINSMVMMAENPEIKTIGQIGFSDQMKRPISAFTRPGTAFTVRSADFNNRMTFQNPKFSNLKNQNSMIKDYTQLVNGSQIQNSNLGYTAYNNQTQDQSSQNIKRNKITFQDYEELEGDQKIMKTKTQIRQLLHPNISQQGLPSKDTIWIPGSKSSKNLGLSGVWKDKNSQNRSKIVRVQSGQNKYFQSDRAKELMEQEKLYVTLQNQKIKTKSLLRFVPDYEEAREQPQIRCGSKYISKLDQEKEEEKQNRKKELGNHVIRTGKPSEPKYDPCITTIGNYNEKSTFLGHSFRQVQKNNWVSHKNFKSAV